MMHVSNKHRIRKGVMGSDDRYGCNGAFQFNRVKYKLRAVVSDGGGWEHVSISRSDRKMPTWLDMQYMKERFWDDEDTVMQLHPPKSEWVSNHDKCLHMWRPTDCNIPMPPAIMVGIKGLKSQTVERMTTPEKIELKQFADEVLAQELGIIAMTQTTDEDLIDRLLESISARDIEEYEFCIKTMTDVENYFNDSVKVSHFIKMFTLVHIGKSDATLQDFMMDLMAGEIAAVRIAQAKTSKKKREH